MFIDFSKNYSFLQLWRKTCAFSLHLIYLLWFRFALLIFCSFLLYQQIKIWLKFFLLKQCFADYGIRLLLAFCPCTWSWTIKIPYEFSLSLSLWLSHAACGVLVLWPGIETEPSQCKHGVLNTGLPGNSLVFLLLTSFVVCLDHLFSIYLAYSKTS